MSLKVESLFHVLWRCGRMPPVALAMLGITVGAGPAFASSGDVASGIATATVIHPLTVSQLADLDFGMVASDAGGVGSVTIAPGNSAILYEGAARPGCSADVACPAGHAARFSVTGKEGSSYSISVPSRIGARDPASDQPALTVESITIQTRSRPAAGATGQLDATGHDSFGVGGTLQVPAGLRAGRYRISIPVVVFYN